jgi:hypothetical protein
MIIPNNAGGRLVLMDIIPSTAFVGSISVNVQNNRRFRGVLCMTQLTAVAGAGQMRLRVQTLMGVAGNSLIIPAYTTVLGAATSIIYPGCTLIAGAAHYSGTIPESMIFVLDNVSPVPGNEVTCSLSICFLE